MKRILAGIMLALAFCHGALALTQDRKSVV